MWHGIVFCDVSVPFWAFSVEITPCSDLWKPTSWRAVMISRKQVKIWSFLNRTIRFTESQGLWSSLCAAATVLLPKFPNGRETAEGLVYKIMTESWKQEHFLTGKDNSLKVGRTVHPLSLLCPRLEWQRGAHHLWGAERGQKELGNLNPSKQPRLCSADSG